MLRSVIDYTDHKPMTNNQRPVQPVNFRDVSSEWGRGAEGRGRGFVAGFAHDLFYDLKRGKRLGREGKMSEFVDKIPLYFHITIFFA